MYTRMLCFQLCFQKLCVKLVLCGVSLIADLQRDLWESHSQKVSLVFNIPLPRRIELVILDAFRALGSQFIGRGSNMAACGVATTAAPKISKIGQTAIISPSAACGRSRPPSRPKTIPGSQAISVASFPRCASRFVDRDDSVNMPRMTVFTPLTVHTSHLVFTPVFTASSLSISRLAHRENDAREIA